MPLYISIFKFIRNFKVPLLLNRQLYVNMGEDRGGLLLLDGTVCWVGCASNEYMNTLSENEMVYYFCD